MRNHKRGGEADAETCSGGLRDRDVYGLRDHHVDGTAGYCGHGDAIVVEVLRWRGDEVCLSVVLAVALMMTMMMLLK